MDCRVVSVNISLQKGVRKNSVVSVLVKEDYGIVNDAHASSNSIRQISFLDMKSIEKMRYKGLNVSYGDFAENITTSGLVLERLKEGSRLLIGRGVEIEVTQIGKQCHTGCAIMQLVGECVMPREGVFGKVIKGGIVSVGDTIVLMD